MRSIPGRILLYLIPLCLLAAPAAATQIVFMPAEELGATADLVVQGTVSEVRSFWNDKHTKIFTETTVAVDETHKGDAPGVVRIVQLGGTVGDIRVTVHGALQWSPGEEVVLFLEAGGADKSASKYMVTGLSQGKFNIVRDPETGAAMVKRPALGDAQITDKLGQEQPAAEMREVPLDTFLRQALGR
jgi:hypothetical protein